ncbi:MAG: hypothetical protein HY748_16285, partial [Elusimicrobia bacterium]|nr:hypothetical protein [Elusimicrobiota bacterium]
VAMQVYAAAMVYNAFRVAQGRIAQQHGIAPEDISPAKLFPKLAEASRGRAEAELMFLRINRANGGNLVKPDISDLPTCQTTLQAILVKKRNGHRRRKYFVRGRKLWGDLTAHRNQSGRAQLNRARLGGRIP